MWLLQCMCDEESFLSFQPEERSKRDFLFQNSNSKQVETVFENGRLAPGLGSNFTFYRNSNSKAISKASVDWAIMGLVLNMRELTYFVQNAKTKIIRNSPEFLQPSLSISP